MKNGHHKSLDPNPNPPVPPFTTPKQEHLWSYGVATRYKDGIQQQVDGCLLCGKIKDVGHDWAECIPENLIVLTNAQAAGKVLGTGLYRLFSADPGFFVLEKILIQRPETPCPF